MIKIPYFYLDPNDENDHYKLPTIRIFKAEENEYESEDGFLEPGFYWQTCLPGCLPDSDPFGPFNSEKEALADARDF